MDAAPGRFPYKCLPLTIANQHGWELLCPFTTEVYWNGSQTPDAVQVRCGGEPSRCGVPMSHFGCGVVTFKLGYLFRTEAGTNLYVSGPPNIRKDGIVPLTGIVEASWLPFTFTMNWVFTRPRMVVRFERDEPFCFIFPLLARLVEETEPLMEDLRAAPELESRYREWAHLRAAYREDLARNGTPRNARGREPFYVRGAGPSGSAPPNEHRTRLHVLPFAAPSAPNGGSD